MFSPPTSLLMSMYCHNQYKLFQSDMLEYKMKVSLQIFCLAKLIFRSARYKIKLDLCQLFSDQLLSILEIPSSSFKLPVTGQIPQK